MTDTSEFQARVLPSASAFDPASGPLLTEQLWGFTVRSSTQMPIWIVLSQVLSFLSGSVFIAAALGIWFVHDGGLANESFVLRSGLCAFFAGLGLVFINYANRGVASELQFDQNLGEIREVLHNRNGTSTLVSHSGFDAFSGLAIDRSKGCPDDVQLILRHQDLGSNLLVASGTEAQIGALFGRLDRELLRTHGDCIDSKDMCDAG